MESNKQTTKIRIKADQRIQVRKKKLFEHLNVEKLQYLENGICDQYIKLGIHDLDYVIDNLKKKEIQEGKRLERLIQEIRKTPTQYDENISWYREYIKKGGDLNKAVHNGSIEWFYLHKTDYPRLLKRYCDEDIAMNKALDRYIEHYGNDRYIEMIRKNDMVIRISI